MPAIAHYLHFPAYHVDTNWNLKVLYLVRVLHDATDKLTLFFLPIFLFQLGFTEKLILLPDASPTLNGLVIMASYYFVMRLSATVSVFALSRIIARHIKLSFILSHLIYAVVFYGLYASATDPRYLLLVAISQGLFMNMFWLSFHQILTRFTLKSRLGKDLGLLQFLVQVIQMGVPSLGGIVALHYGFSALFLVGLGTIIVSALVSLGLDSSSFATAVTVRQILTVGKQRGFRRHIISIIGRYFHEATIVLWPLYVFLRIGHIERVGFIYSFSYVLAMLLPFAFGAYVDHTKRKGSFLFSGGVLSGLWFLRSYATSISGFVFIEAVERLVANFHWLYYDMLVYKTSKNARPFAYFVAREVVNNFSALIYWILVIGIFVATQGNWQILFFVAAGGALASALMTGQLK